MKKTIYTVPPRLTVKEVNAETGFAASGDGLWFEDMENGGEF